MAYRRTAAQIMQDALKARNLVDDDDEVWHHLSRTFYGTEKKLYRAKTLYKDFERGKFKTAKEGSPLYEMFGDPRHIPSYETFRKYLRMGGNSVLADPANWSKLPDSFEGLYQLSFYDVDVLRDCLERNIITKRTTLQAVQTMRGEIDLTKLEQIARQSARPAKAPPKPRTESATSRERRESRAKQDEIIEAFGAEVWRKK